MPDEGPARTYAGLTLILALVCCAQMPPFQVLYYASGSALVLPKAQAAEVVSVILGAFESAEDRLQLLVMEESIQEMKESGGVEIVFERPTEVRPRIGGPRSVSLVFVPLPEPGSTATSDMVPIFWGETSYASGPYVVDDTDLVERLRGLVEQTGG